MAMQPIDLDDLYQDLILDHYRNPRNRRKLEQADIDRLQYNPVCGDEIRIQLQVRGGRIEEASFSGGGCSISQASASMLTEALQGKSLQEAKATAARFRLLMQGEPTDLDALGDLAALQGVSYYPVRIKCAVLAWDTLQEGVRQWEAAKEG